MKKPRNDYFYARAPSWLEASKYDLNHGSVTDVFDLVIIAVNM